MSVRIIIGDCREKLAELPDESVHCVVTSPPYWGLRDYGVLPTIWGGDPACGHVWADASWRPDRWGAHDDETTGAKQQTNGGSVGHRGQVKEQALCSTCGAWRGTFGLEPTFALYVEHSVEVFRAIRRVLRKDGTIWLNLGDSYCAAPPATKNAFRSSGLNGAQTSAKYRERLEGNNAQQWRARDFGPLKSKDLCGIPWRIAFALQADGWYLRQDIIWSKPNPMPESVTDRCTKAHEYIFLLSKSERYYFDQDAIREPFVGKALADLDGGPQRNRDGSNANDGRNFRHGQAPADYDRLNSRQDALHDKRGRNANRSSYRPGSASNMNGGEHEKKSDAGLPVNLDGRNKRSVWEVPTSPYAEAHFATFPPALIEPCILAGCPKGGYVLDPFGGAGTTGLVADRLQRNAILIELNPDYAAMAERRIYNDAPLFADAAE